MTKKINSLLFVLLFVGVGLVSVLSPYRPTYAAPSNCPDPVDRWFDCWQKFSSVEGYVNTWCSLAPATKAKGKNKSAKDECRDFLLGSINYKPSGLRDSDRCNSKEEALKNKECYVLVSSSANSGTWYKALEKFPDECGGFESAKRDCRERQWEAFLEPKGWAPKENPQGQQSGSLTDPQDTPFAQRVATYLKWLMVGIGLLGVFSLIIAGMQYSAAQDNPQSVSAAKNRIVNVVIGFLLYLVMFAMLQWLVPGGIF